MVMRSVNGYGPFKVLAVKEIHLDVVPNVGHSQHLTLLLKYKGSFSKRVKQAKRTEISGAFFA